MFLFISYNGHYSDSPRVLSEYMHCYYPQKKIVWLLKKKYFANVPEYIKKVDIDGFKAIIYRGKAGTVIDNVFGYKETNLYNKSNISKIKFWTESWLKDKRNQKVFSTWHGTPLKKMGRDQVGLTVIDFSCPNTTMFLSNSYAKNIMQHLTFDKMEMLLMGTPRNDLLFRSGEEIKRIKKNLGLDIEKKIILFAPTFRSFGFEITDENVNNSGLYQISQLPIDDLLDVFNEFFGGDWLFVCRFHYLVEERVDWNILKEKYGNRIINGNATDDISLYLLSSDILITDVSSCMFDFSIMDKPCFLFFPDIEHYIQEERGIYIPFENLPFPMAKNYEDLKNMIVNFDNSTYLKELKQLKEKMGYVDKRNSGLEILNYILNLTTN